MNSGNKKIRNATRKADKGITFKSQLEKTIYNTLLQQGIEAKYEPKTFILWDGFTPITPFFDKETPRHKELRLTENPNDVKSTILVLKTGKIIGIRYTPDFYFKYGDYDVYIEAKGIENDVFYIKKKMFLKYLDDDWTKTGQKSIYFEVYTKKQLLQALEILKAYEQSEQDKRVDKDIAQ